MEVVLAVGENLELDSAGVVSSNGCEDLDPATCMSHLVHITETKEISLRV